MAPTMPPAFEEAANCAICGSGFGTFKRRHHCRACGRTLCNEHSSNQMALPQFGLHAPVRVCKDCFTVGDKIAPAPVLEEQKRHGDQISVSDVLVSDFPSLRLGEEAPSRLSTTPSTSVVQDTNPKFECKCGMPLCICTAPDPPKIAAGEKQQVGGTSSRVKKTITTSKQPQPRSIPAKQSPSLFFTGMQSAITEDHASCRNYDLTGEGMREAIKNGDTNAVQDLLLKGVDANYTDKQGMSLLHLAAVFNLTDVAFMLLDAGANAYSKNSQGETPLDCAQATLQLKLQEKLANR